MKTKDYELVAGAIKDARATWNPDTEERKTCLYALDDAAKTIAEACKQQNARFNTETFLTACGIEV